MGEFAEGLPKTVAGSLNKYRPPTTDAGWQEPYRQIQTSVSSKRQH